MPQIFGPAWDTWLRVMLLSAVITAGGALLVLSGLVQSQFITGAEIAPDQPVPFSHKHHVGGLGIDCRYCHAAVEISTSAGLPPTETCMTCHSQLWTDADLLRPVRESWKKRQPIHWQRVHDLPDYTYFDHSIHVRKGVGCDECHGPVDTMPIMRQGNIMRMQFCIACHRDPAPRLRPRSQVFNLRWHPPPDRRALGEALVREYGIDAGRLTHCYICHR
ncbi:MAG TPA: cytochrome c3 family protein [Woeseiaceae bacterium]|nr:cytochrome c3 family protein [Woeseiaceae bacterium]